MSNLRQPFTTAIGRFVGGSLTEPKTQDAEGKPLVYKSGPNVGKPRQTYDFAMAIPKVPGAHWGNPPPNWDEANQGKYWGSVVWAVGTAGFPNGQWQRPDFAWKITDGDSQVPNKKGVKPCSREGYPGHWVLWFSSEFAPRTFNSNGTAPVDPASIKMGHFIQVNGTVDTNGSDNQPGIFLNHTLVAHSGFGPEIINGPDPTSVGFGRGPAPAGMSATPVGGLPPAPGAAAPPPAASLPAPPSAAPAPAAVAPPPAAAAPMPTPTPTAVTPHPGFLGGAPAAPPVPTAPAAPPAPAPGPVMTAKAGGHSYAALIAAGWTDATLRANGMMV